MRKLCMFRLAAALLALSGLAWAGCGSQTAGEALSFDTAALGLIDAGSPAQAFTNNRGWTITLQTARLAMGPVYYYSGDALVRRGDPLLERLLGIGTAYACPAHAQLDKGAVLGEIRRQYVVDLLADAPADTGVSHGEQGQCRAFELHFHPPGQVTAGSDETAFAPLYGHSFVIGGVAGKDGASVAFSGLLTIPDEGTMRIVESVPADLALDGRPGKAVVRIHVDRQLANLDFASIVDDAGACLEDAGEGICRISQDSQAYLAWLSGVRSRESYSLEWRE